MAGARWGFSRLDRLRTFVRQHPDSMDALLEALNDSTNNSGKLDTFMQQITGGQGTKFEADKDADIIRAIIEQEYLDPKNAADAAKEAATEEAVKASKAETADKEARAKEAYRNISGLGDFGSGGDPRVTAAIVGAKVLANGLGAAANIRQAHSNKLAAALMRRARSSTGMHNQERSPVFRGIADQAEQQVFNGQRDATLLNTIGGSLNDAANIVSGRIAMGNNAYNNVLNGYTSAAAQKNGIQQARVGTGQDSYGREGKI